MKYPVYLTPLSLLVWGWLTANLLIAGLLISLLLSSYFLHWRIRLSDYQFFRVGDFISLVICTVLIYSYMTHAANRPIFIILEWLPLFYAPVLFAQLFSTRDKLPLGTLFYSLRGSTQADKGEIDFLLPYSGICLLAAGAANVQTPIYYLACISLIAILLWQVRNRKSPILIWLALLSFASTISYTGYQRLYQAHDQFEQKMVSWLSEMMLDPYKSSTHLGDIGQLKLSNKIVMRVKTQQPILLHQASYDHYINNSWYASIRGFRQFQNENIVASTQQLGIIQTINKKSILALPAGSYHINGLKPELLSYNSLGSVQIDQATGFSQFEVSYTGRFESFSGKYDQQIPKLHLPWLKQVVLPLQDLTSTQNTVSNIKHFFENGFFYTLYNDQQQSSDQALIDFILNRKAGHCEYFAVATVLMLRYAGIPARLANGYSVQEYDPDDQLYLVRNRHAHAWAWAYLDGYWQAVDTTPTQWLAIEEQQVQPWQHFEDWFSNLVYHFNHWRSEQSEQDNRPYQILVVALLALFLLFRLYKNRRFLIKNRLDHGINWQRMGMDSELFLVEKKLRNTDQMKSPDESLQQWVQRLNDPELTQLLHLHNRYRFDPNGLKKNQRLDLKKSALSWISQWSDKH